MQRDRVGAARDFERDARRRASCDRRRPPAPAPAARLRRSGRCETAARLRRRTRPSVANTSATRPVIGARRTNALPAAAPPPVRSVSSRWASRASAARSRASATVTARRASSTRRAGTARSASSRSARDCSARAASSRGLRFGDVGGERRAIVAGRQARLEPPEQVDLRARSRQSRSATSAANRPAAGAATMASPPVTGSMTAGTRTDRPHVRLPHLRRGERVGPLLFLQVGDRGRIVRRPLLGVGQRRLARRRTPSPRRGRDDPPGPARRRAAPIGSGRPAAACLRRETRPAAAARIPAA